MEGRKERIKKERGKEGRKEGKKNPASLSCAVLEFKEGRKQGRKEKGFGELTGLQPGFRQTPRLITIYHIIIIDPTDKK